MIKYLIFFVIFQQLLMGSFLDLDEKKFASVKNFFGKKAVHRVKYVQIEFKKIEKDELQYAKVYRINKLINKLIYKPDRVHWKKSYTPTFLEFIASGAGDSLDFAIAKYLLLTHLGFDKNKFSFFTIDSKNLNRAEYEIKDHYVLGYLTHNSLEYVILDWHTDELKLAYKDGIKFQFTDVNSKMKALMRENMLKIKFK